MRLTIFSMLCIAQAAVNGDDCATVSGDEHQSLFQHTSLDALVAGRGTFQPVVQEAVEKQPAAIEETFPKLELITDAKQPALMTANKHAEELAFVQKVAQNLKSGSSIDDATKTALSAINATHASALAFIQDSHDSAQNELNTLADNAASCLTNFTNRTQENVATKSILDGLELQHEECRTILSTQNTDSTQACDEQTSFVASLSPPSSAIPSDADVTFMENYWNAWDTFMSNSAIWQTRQTACQAATASKETQESSCDTAQSTFESTSCALRLSVLSSCSEYGSCQQMAASSFNTTLTTEQLQEATRKAEWTAISKIECFVNAILAGDSSAVPAAVDACESLVPDASHLTLSVPSLPTVAACDLTHIQAFPCNTVFSAKYDGMLGVDGCQLCTPLPEHLEALASGESSGGSSGGGGSGQSMSSFFSSMDQPEDSCDTCYAGGKKCAGLTDNNGEINPLTGVWADMEAAGVVYKGESAGAEYGLGNMDCDECYAKAKEMQVEYPERNITWMDWSVVVCYAGSHMRYGEYDGVNLWSGHSWYVTVKLD